MKKRLTLYADDGKRLTKDGKNCYLEITLEVGQTDDDWHEITEEEYNAIQAAEEVAE